MARRPSTAQASGSRSKSTTKSQSAKSGVSKPPPSKRVKRRRDSTPLDDRDEGEAEEEGESYDADDDDAYNGEGEAENAMSDDERSLHSDDLDNDSDDFATRKKAKKSSASTPRSTQARGKGGSTKGTPIKSGTKRKRTSTKEDDAYSDVSLADGQQVVGRIVQAPTTGRVPPGRISQNTFDFLKELTKPECNDREWFKLHDPVWRQAEKEWVDFVDALLPKVSEMDDQIPPMPPKDLIHRIYRDVRFSNDKTPYKTNLSMSVSRSGRKGIFACYHVSISPGQSMVAAGIWCPGKNETATIRNHILRNPSRLRGVISSKEFVKLFGPPKPHKSQNERQNIFGREDTLKVAPKGISKEHKDIDLLKLRSIAVIHRFLDSEVIDPKFADSICSVMNVMKPLVHCLNDMMTIPPDESDEEEGGA